MVEQHNDSLGRLLEEAKRNPLLINYSCTIVPDNEDEDVFYLRVSGVPDEAYAKFRNTLETLIDDIIPEDGPFIVIPSIRLQSEMHKDCLPEYISQSLCSDSASHPYEIPQLDSFTVFSLQASTDTKRSGGSYDCAA